jgi:prophage maintenance system killer protein
MKKRWVQLIYGNKRIAAAIFTWFLERNDLLYKFHVDIFIKRHINIACTDTGQYSIMELRVQRSW